MLDELARHAHVDDADNSGAAVRAWLAAAAARCLVPNVTARPSFAQLADGDIRNAAHGIRRAFEFEPNVVAEGPGVSCFDGLVGEFAASLERRIDRGLPMTEDHWLVRGALLYYQGEYEDAMYALQAAKDAGDESRGRKALDRLIAEKLEMYAE